MNNWKESLYFTKTEQNGIVILSILCVSIFLLPHFLEHFVVKAQTDFSDFEKQVEYFLAIETESKVKEYKDSLFYFDPNTANFETLQKLDLPAKTIHTILKYRDKVGAFQQASDLSKIYNLSKTDYQRILPYIRINDITSTKVGEEEEAKIGIKDSISSESIELESFDPNSVSRERLLSFGVREKVVNTWMNFREKGGRFYKSDDVKKIYGLSDENFQRLKPYIKMIAEGEESVVVNPQKKLLEPTTEFTIDVNQSTVEDWQQLRGIGKVLSNRIVNFRDKLGGFSNIDQVADTYNLPDSTFQRIKIKLKLSPIQRKIEINFITAAELGKHPYISMKKAKTIINYRKNHGLFSQLEDFQKIKVLSTEEHRKIAPYLSFD